MVQENNLKPKIIVICGPTASGKTALAVECAKLLNTEVISADSMYIYKNMQIGTAKPTIDEIDGVKHHLIDVIDPDISFSVSDYKSLAEPILKNILDKNKVPIICGGTGFYINSLLYDLSYGNSKANVEVREIYNELALKYGNEYVYNVLKEVDPLTAQKLHHNDLKRVIRALEIYESGTKKSEITDNLVPKYDFSAFMINHKREDLYKRIDKRVDLMINNGLIQEIENLIKAGINKNHQSMQAIGYKEFFEYFDGKFTLEQTIDKIKLNTRHYAKRQITFFKKLNATMLEPNDVKLLAQKVVNEIN